MSDGHCLIVPMGHVMAGTSLDEDVWEEIQDYRKALVKMFRQRRSTGRINKAVQVEEVSSEDIQVRTTGRLWSKCSGRGGLQEGSSQYVQVEEDYRKYLFRLEEDYRKYLVKISRQMTKVRIQSKCSGRRGRQEGSNQVVQVQQDYRKDLVKLFRYSSATGRMQSRYSDRGGMQKGSFKERLFL